MATQANVVAARLYKCTIDEVVNTVREAFLDEGIDEQVLQELKQIWESKVLATKVIDSFSDQPIPLSTTHGRSQNAGVNMSTSAAAVSAQQSANRADPSAKNPQPAIAPIINATRPVGQFPQLATHALHQVSGPTLATANFALQPGVVGVPSSSLIIPGGVHFINATSLPTISAAHLMQVGQSIGAQANIDGGSNLPQVDGPVGLSDDDDDEENEENDETQDLDEDTIDVGLDAEEGEPLNSDDDVSNENADEMFEADNVVVCQYEKVTRTRNKWRFVLKDGVMNLDGKDYVFNKAQGEAEF